MYHLKEKYTLKEILAINLRDFFRVGALWKAFTLGIGLSFWWAIHSIYIPIYITEHGYSDFIVGIVLAASIVPLLLLEKHIGKLADKHGLRVYLSIGFIILALVLPLFQVIPIISIVLLLMAAINIGAAFIEPLTETYFFKVIKKKDEDRFYGIYSMADPFASVLGPLIAAGFLFLGGYAGLWYGTAVIMLIFAVVALTVRK